MQLTLEELNKALSESVEHLTEAQFQLLVENRIEFIKNTNKDKISTEHDPESASMSTDKIVDTIAKKIDPTTRKTHTEWLVNRYKAGDFKLGEAKDVKKALNAYEDAAPHIPNKDIKSFKSLSDLKDQVAPATMRVEHNAKPADAMSDKGETEIYNEGGVRGFKLESKAASIRNYGPNGHVAKTVWCTASNGSNNMFNGYKGGKYTMRFPNGRVLQIHHQSGQLKDEQNSTINMEKNPAYSPFAEHISNFIKKTHELEGKPDSSLLAHGTFNTAEDIQSEIDAHDKLVERVKAKHPQDYKHDLVRAVRDKRNNIGMALKNSKPTDEQVEKLKKFESIDYYNETPKHYDMTTDLHENSHLPAHQVDNLVEHEMANTDLYDARSHLMSLVKHPNISDESLHKAIGWAGKNVDTGHFSLLRDQIMNSPNAKPEHFNRLGLNDHEKTRVVIDSQSSHIPAEFFEHAKETNPATVAEHPQAPAHILDELANRHNPQVSSKLLRNPNLSKENLRKIMDNHHEVKLPVSNMRELIDRPDLEAEDRSAIVNRYVKGGIDSTSGPGWLTSNRLSRDDLHSVIHSPVIGDAVGSHSHSILNNPKIRHGELNEIINGPGFSHHLAERILANPHVRTSNVDAMMQKDSKNPHITEAILQSHSNAIQPHHISAILNHPEISTLTKIDALEHGANTYEHFAAVKGNPKFHGAISASRNAPPSILHELSTSPHQHVRENVASNPNTENRTLAILKHDADEDVAKIAAKRIK